MKHILLAALLAAPVMAVAATINADNNYVTRSLSVRGTFNELEVSQIDVEYTVAPSVRIELIAPSNVAPLVEVRIEDNTLTARLRSETNVHYESGRAHARLRVSGPMLKDIEAKLGSAFKSTSIFNGDKLSLEVETAGTITLGTVTMSRELDVDANTSGTVTIAGPVRAPKAELECNTASTVRISGINGGVYDVEANTGSTVNLAGTARSINVEANTGATVDASGLSTDTATGSSATGASAKVNAASASGISSSTGGSFRNIR